MAHSSILMTLFLDNGDECSYDFWENLSQCCRWCIRCFQWYKRFFSPFWSSPHAWYTVTTPMVAITGGLLFAMLGVRTPAAMFVFAAIFLWVVWVSLPAALCGTIIDYLTWLVTSLLTVLMASFSKSVAEVGWVVSLAIAVSDMLKIDVGQIKDWHCHVYSFFCSTYRISHQWSTSSFSEVLVVSCNHIWRSMFFIAARYPNHWYRNQRWRSLQGPVVLHWHVFWPVDSARQGACRLYS